MATKKSASKSATTKLPNITSDQASQIVKKYASKQKINIKLSEAQVQEILRQVKNNPKQPAEITFYAGRKPVINVKVAAYWYSGDTCCV